MADTHVLQKKKKKKKRKKKKNLWYVQTQTLMRVILYFALPLSIRCLSFIQFILPNHSMAYIRHSKKKDSVMFLILLHFISEITVGIVFNVGYH